MKIRVRSLNENCNIKAFKKGEWIDLRCSVKTELSAPHNAYKTRVTKFDTALIPLGLAMELPKHFEANILSRSSTFKHHGILQTNAMGVIDSSYSGDNDEWKLPVIALRKTTIDEKDRIAQFRIRPSQFAPWWVKLKWLFTSSIEFDYVETLGNKDRGGFGSSGVN